MMFEPEEYVPNPLIPGARRDPRYLAWFQQYAPKAVRLSLFASSYVIPTTNESIREALASKALGTTPDKDPRAENAYRLNLTNLLLLLTDQPFQESDPTLHRQQRKNYLDLVKDASLFIPLIRRVAKESMRQLRSLASYEQVNLSDVTRRIVMQSMFELMGLEGDIERVHQYVLESLAMANLGLPDEELIRIDRVAGEYFEYMKQMLHDGEKAYPDGILQRYKRHLPEEKILSFATASIPVFYTDPWDLLNNAFRRVSQLSAEQRAAIEHKPSLMRNLAYETARLDAVIGFVPRVASKTVLVGGELVEEGAGVLCIPQLGQVDPCKYPDPQTFNYERDPEQTDLLIFGGGMHACVGKRLTMDVLVPTVLQVAFLEQGLRITYTGDFTEKESAFFLGETMTPGYITWAR